MEKIIKTIDSDIDVNEIMRNIQARAKEINPDDIDKEISLIDKYGYNLDTKVSPFILTYLKKPISKKIGFISNLSNLIIRKIYYVIWNSIGDVLTQQQIINKALIKRIEALENELNSSNNRN